MSIDAHKETLGFQTEVKQLLKLMIHSLYSNKEIFLRELISNASDACDKLRFEALKDDALYENDPELRIHVDFDKDGRTIRVRDNGVGMSREEVTENIGTIARSGTRRFLDSLTGDQAKDSQLIGQFGVGFYSSFIVADRVEMRTRRAGMGREHGVLWTSDGAGEFSVETIDRPQRGTEVILHLREGEDELLDEWRLRSMVTRYSDHISLPVIMPTTKPADKEGEKETVEEETVNRASALWTRPRNDITEEEYKDFYKHVAHDFEDPLGWTHNRVEGRYEYTTLLYVPSRAPFDLWDREQRHGPKLFVRRVFIMEDPEQLMPRYLRFVRGVIDSNDLPLNVSRELLQGNKVVDSIRSGSVKKVLGLLEDMASNRPDDYKAFWKEFGRVLKEGPGEDPANREQVAGLLRFASTHSDTEEADTSLADYVARMKPDQKKIYYITADSFAAARHSPHLEVFRKQGVEVLLLHDRVDEWLVANLQDFDGKSLQSVAKGSLDLAELGEPDEKEKTDDSEHKALLERIKEVLGDRVQEVRASRRLTDSPACLVASEHALSGNLERLLREAGQDVPLGRPILEINAGHPLVRSLGSETDEKRFADWVQLLFDQSLLAEGGQLEDPAVFVRRLNDLLMAQLLSGR